MRPRTRHERLLLAFAQVSARAGERWSAEDARQHTGLPLEYIRFIMRRLLHQGKILRPELYSPVITNLAERARSHGIVSIRSDEEERLLMRRLAREVLRLP